MEKISVITVVFNDANNIIETMNSVLNQTYGNIEYIIIDGKSTDGTTEKIVEYIKTIANITKNNGEYLEATKKDNANFSLKFLSQSDSGIYDAMNKGIDLASGAWCNFMNSGDRFYDNSAIERIFAAYRAGGGQSSIIYGDTEIIYDNLNRKILKSTTTKHKYRHHFIHQAAFIKSNIMKSYKYDTTFKIAGDTDFFTRCYNNGESFRHFDEIVISFNVEGVSSRLSWLMFKEDCIIGFKYNKFFPLRHFAYYVFWVVPRVFTRNIIPSKYRNKARVFFGKKRH
ncbi:glycosyltransferase family 2 protein [Helicobacter sp. 23-1044]